SDISLELLPIEQSEAMRRFFHNLSEYSDHPGPFQVLSRDFATFDPDTLRGAAIDSEIDDYYDERRASEFANIHDIKAWGDNLYRYPLILFSYFLTTPDMVGE